MYKIGQIVKFDEDGLNGLGVIVKFGVHDGIHLVKLLGDLQGQGHDGGYEPRSRDYWWISDWYIEYGLDGNKVVR